MYAASGIEEGRVRRSKHRTVGMTGDKENPLLFCPACTGSFYLFLFCIVLRGACGVQKAYIFKRLPKIPDEKAGEAP